MTEESNQKKAIPGSGNLVANLFLLGMTLLTMIAFASNSIIGRAALKPDLKSDSQMSDNVIDASSYTVIRVVFGAIVLLGIQLCRRITKSGSDESLSGQEKPYRFGRPLGRCLLAAAMLAVYAVAFSFAYVGLDTATGTLILFTFVPITMISIGVYRGEKTRPIELLGLLVASGGLVYLVIPKTGTPQMLQAILMASAGIGWGVYSVLGKGSDDPIRDTTWNFVFAAPVACLVAVCFLSSQNVPIQGAVLAAVSGGVTSGLGYVFWYSILPKISSVQASAVQLSVPIIAALGGAVFVGDRLTSRILIAGLLILLGIAMTIRWRKIGNS